MDIILGVNVLEVETTAKFQLSAARRSHHEDGEEGADAEGRYDHIAGLLQLQRHIQAEL